MDRPRQRAVVNFGLEHFQFTLFHIRQR